MADDWTPVAIGEPAIRESRHQKIADFWKSKGAPEHVALGIADDVVQKESGGNPAAVNKESGATGVYQDLGDRKTRLQAMPNWQSIDTQNEHAYGDVTGGDKIATENWPKVKGAKTREEAKKLWNDTFERPGRDWSPIGVGNNRVSDKWVRFEQGRNNASVRYADIDDLLGMVEPIEGDETSAQKRKSLQDSLDAGDEIEAGPTIDVKRQGNKLKVIDYDGRHRLEALKEAGVKTVPVSFIGAGNAEGVTEIEDMHGKVRSFDFKPVPQVPRETPGQRMAQDRGAQFAADRQAEQATMAAHQQGAAAKVYYNEAGQPFTLGDPQQGPPQPQPERMPGEIPGVGRLSDQIASVIGGVVQGGRMITGEEPVTRLLPENVVGAAAAIGGAALPPGSRFTPGLPRIAQEGQNMIGAAQEARAMPIIQRGPPPLSQITPERAALAQDALQRGIPVTGAQNAATQVARERALHTAVSHTFGENAPALTPEVLARAQKRIGDGLNRIEQGHSVPFDPEFRSDIIEISNDAKSQLTTPGQINVVEKHLKDVMVDPVKTAAAKKAAQSAPKTPGKPAAKPKEVLRSGLSGEQFGNLIHEKGPISKLANNPDPGVALFGEKIETALRDLLQRRLPTDQAAEYQGLRYQYKNLKTAEKAVGSVGEIDPAKLDSAVSRAFPDRKRNKNAEMVKLSDIANEFVKKPPAPPEASSSSWVKAAEVGAGALVGHLAAGPIGGAVGAALAIGGHMAARNMMRSLTQPRLTESLIRRALQELPPPGARRNAINAMMSQRGANTLTMPGGGNAMSGGPPSGMRQFGAPGGSGWPGRP